MIRRVLALAGAAAAVAAVAIGVSALPRPTSAGSGAVQDSGSPPGGDPRMQTEALLTGLITRVMPPPGAMTAMTAPVRALRSAPEAVASPNLVQRSRWWTTPGTVDDALGYFRSHPPDGLRADGVDMLSGGKNGVVQQSLAFAHGDTGYAREVQVLISVIGYGGRAAIGAYAQAIWIPPRDPATLLTGVRSVHVIVTRSRAAGRPGAPTVVRTLGGTAAGELADVINHLPGATPGIVSCPAEFPGITNQLDFATDNTTVRVVEELTGCAGVQITLADGSTHAFQAGRLNATLMRLLGLPENYGLSSR